VTDELARIGRLITYDRRGYARSGGGDRIPTLPATSRSVIGEQPVAARDLPRRIDDLPTRSLTPFGMPVGLRRPWQRRLPAEIRLDEDRPAPGIQRHGIPG
jgi:hypothetical protein